MINLEIIDKDNYIYILKDKGNNKYDLNLEFFDLEEKPQVGDYIRISAELLNPRYAGYCGIYTFEKLKDGNEEKIANLEDTEKMIIIKNEKEIYLKRIYG